VSTAWANHALAGANDTFETLHAGLTIRLVATPRHEPSTCRKDDLVSAVLAANRHDFDFIPVVGDSHGGSPFVGMFHAADARTRGDTERLISSVYLPLAEEYLIGADASILEFIVQADVRPCRLVVSGSQVDGLVTLSDLQRLPVRAALFALVTGFEMTMIDLIKSKLPDESAWLAMLKPTRLDKIQKEISIAQTKDAFVDKLLFTQFADKAEIVLNLPGMRRPLLEQRLKEFQNLGDNLAHANEYAASPDQARHVCSVVRHLLALRHELHVL
jgi:hypothetical protein